MTAHSDANLRIGSLCSGIGGLELAVAAAFGGEVAWQCEHDRHASTVLARRFPGVTNYGDVTTTDWAEIEPVDVMCFGFPCQDISYAGAGAGIKEGTRSGLWFACWDAVRVLRPRWVVIENVAALLSRRPGFDVCAADMAASGYDFRWRCLRAADVGACHGRDRVFVVASDASGAGREGPRPAVADGRREPANGPASDARSERAGWLDRGLPGTPDGARWAREHLRASVDDPAASPDPEGVSVTHEPVGGHKAGQHVGPVDRAGVGDREGRTTEGVRELGRAASLVGTWGKYADAIARWELLTGLTAPCPTIEGKKLNPALVEWMMGYWPGWVTEAGIPRTAQLHGLGNAVMPAQGYHALRWLAGVDLEPERERELAAHAEGQRLERSGPARDRRAGLEDRLLPTPTAWLGRREAHAKGDPARWENPMRSNELSDCVAHIAATQRGEMREGTDV